MPPLLVGATYTFTEDNSANSIPLTPPGILAGDQLFLYASVFQGQMPAVAGWTLEGQDPFYGGGNVALYYRQATGGDTAPTFPLNAETSLPLEYVSFAAYRNVASPSAFTGTFNGDYMNATFNGGGYNHENTAALPPINVPASNYVIAVIQPGGNPDPLYGTLLPGPGFTLDGTGGSGDAAWIWMHTEQAVSGLVTASTRIGPSLGGASYGSNPWGQAMVVAGLGAGSRSTMLM